MLKGVCKDPGQVSVLKKGESYYLFPAGFTHYYASKFPNKNSHRGCFEKGIFDLISGFVEPEDVPKIEAAVIDIELKEDEFGQLSLF